MPTDLKAIVYGQIWNGMNTAAGAYNTAIASMTLAGCQPVPAILDNRGIGRQQAKTGGQPSYFLVGLAHTGGNAPTTPTKTFALAAGIPNTDTVQKRILTLEMKIAWDSGVISDSGITPLISYIDAQFAVLYPKLNLAYGRDFTWRDVQKQESAPGAGGSLVSQEVLRRSITVELWPHTSDLV